MQMRKLSMISIVVVTVALLVVSLVLAAEQKITLSPGPAGEGARGEATVKDVEGIRGMEQKEIAINASGLKPNSVYTVWFVNEKPKMDMAGVGLSDYSFRTDDKGSGSYTAMVNASELEKWDILEVAYHPDANPKNMKNIEIALKANLKQPS